MSGFLSKPEEDPFVEGLTAREITDREQV